MTEYNDIDTMKLWPHQIAALEMIEGYLAEGSASSALVKMPTGAGKTGVIAILTRLRKTAGNSLVIAPSVAVCRQLEKEISRNFFTKLQCSSTLPSCYVKRFEASELAGILRSWESKKSERLVLICTMQSIHSLYSDEDTSLYDTLKDILSIVVVDEGHREPASQWAKSIRGLQCPTVLFTATPYRNDFRTFDIDIRHSSVFSHKDAQDLRFIKPVDFVETTTRSPKEFVSSLISLYDDKIRLSEFDSDARVVIRCETSNEIKVIQEELTRRGRKSVAIHDTFENAPPLFKDVPDTDTVDATFWVHQHKLTEGIDDPRFSLLAVFSAPGNKRALIQQIGRIIRNPEGLDGRTAYVLCHTKDRLKSAWELYIEYDDAFSQSPSLYDFRQYIRNVQSGQPVIQYLDGEFRQILSLDEVDARRHILFKPSCNVFELDATFDINQLFDSFSEQLNDLDIETANVVPIDERTKVHLYIEFCNSPLLNQVVFLEHKVKYCIYKQIGNLLFLYDDSGNVPEYLMLHGRRIDPDRLESLLGEMSSVSQISLLNGDMSRFGVRRRSLTAASISDTSPGLADHINFCSTATGRRSAGGERRYIGFSRGRVSKPSSGLMPYEDYIAWLDDLATVLTRPFSGSTILNRYAPFSHPPANTTPLSVLFDLDDAMSLYKLKAPNEDGKQPNLLIDETYYEVTSGSLEIVANDNTYHASICYNSDRRRYELECTELEKDYVATDPRQKTSLVKYLNSSQPFRVTPADSEYIYGYGRFYRPRIPLAASPERLALLNLIIPVPELSRASSEKGETATADGWQSDSVFGIIDAIDTNSSMLPFCSNIDLLVCDDLDDEMADFIAITDRSIVFMHAKCPSITRKASASVFHEVCSQAVKNLEFLQPFLSKVPKVDRWDGDWSINKIGTVSRRIRRPMSGCDSKMAWEKIRNAVSDPNIQREVWIVLGRGLSKSTLERSLKGKDTPTEVVQLYYLLQSTWSAVSSIGGTLRVFCSE